MALKANKITGALQFAAQNGLDVDDALDQLTELVETADRRHLTSIKTEIGTKANGEPVIVGWDTCYACKQHISNCTCSKGPVQPEYIARWVAEEAARHGSTTSVGSTENSKVPFIAGEGSDSGESAISSGANGSVGVRSDTVPVASCSSCGKGVTDQTADLNDDGTTWTCFDCQTGS